MSDEKIEIDGIVFELKTCPICGKENRNGICLDCVQQYLPLIKAFLDKYPGLTYMDAVWHKQRPVPPKVFYEMVNAGLIKVKDK